MIIAVASVFFCAGFLLALVLSIPAWESLQYMELVDVTD